MWTVRQYMSGTVQTNGPCFDHLRNTRGPDLWTQHQSLTLQKEAWNRPFRDLTTVPTPAPSWARTETWNSPLDGFVAAQKDPILLTDSTPQLPFKIPQIPSNRDYKALNRVTLGGLIKQQRKLPGWRTSKMPEASFTSLSPV